MTWALVALGGAAGALLRDLAARRLGAVDGTDMVNRVGSVLLGVVIAAAFDAGVVDVATVELLGVGLAGGMTTFSTWMVQVVETDHTPGWPRLVRETLIGLALAALALTLTSTLLA